MFNALHSHDSHVTLNHYSILRPRGRCGMEQGSVKSSKNTQTDKKLHQPLKLSFPINIYRTLYLTLKLLSHAEHAYICPNKPDNFEHLNVRISHAFIRHLKAPVAMPRNVRNEWQVPCQISWLATSLWDGLQCHDGRTESSNHHLAESSLGVERTAAKKHSPLKPVSNNHQKQLSIGRIVTVQNRLPHTIQNFENSHPEQSSIGTWFFQYFSTWNGMILGVPTWVVLRPNPPWVQWRLFLIEEFFGGVSDGLPCLWGAGKNWKNWSPKLNTPIVDIHQYPIIIHS